jgi:hypothetical protein
MQSDAHVADAAAVDELLKPAYWLVSGLEWQGDSARMCEAAFAIAPSMISRYALSHDAFQVLGCADLNARKYGQRVVFLSDLTRMFAVAGKSWSQFGVDWESALAELCEGRFPAMYLTISERAHQLLCNPAILVRAMTPGAADDFLPEELELARQAIARQLAADWPVYMQRIIDGGRVSLAG